MYRQVQTQPRKRSPRNPCLNHPVPVLPRASTGLTHPIQTSPTHPTSPCLEPLLLHLRLGGRNGRSGVGVDKAAAVLAVLELGGLGRADADAARVSAAAAAAVGVVDAPARDELAAVAGADVLGAGVVGRDRRGGEGDCGWRSQGIVFRENWEGV